MRNLFSRIFCRRRRTSQVTLARWFRVVSKVIRIQILRAYWASIGRTIQHFARLQRPRPVRNNRGPQLALEDLLEQ